MQPDHASSRDPGHPWGGCPGSMGSAQPGASKSAAEVLHGTEKALPPVGRATLAQINAASMSRYPNLDLLPLEKERKAAGARAEVRTYVSAYYMPRRAPRHALPLAAHDICTLICMSCLLRTTHNFLVCLFAYHNMHISSNLKHETPKSKTHKSPTKYDTKRFACAL